MAWRKVTVQLRFSLFGAGFVVGLVLLGACSPERAKEPARQVTVNAAQTTKSIPPLAVLIDSLKRLPGRVEDHPPATWSLEGDGGVFAALGHYQDSAVANLVECLGDTTQSATVYHGHRVAVGLVCYAALANVAYTEVDDSGDWPGAVLPSIDGRGLLKARDAWRVVVRDKAYRLL
jgi:hypothetical protein